MAFMVYAKKDGDLIQTGENFSLAGYNLVHSLWEKRGKPIDEGWHMSADDLIREHSEGSGSAKTHALLIDFHPRSRERIGIIELLDVYAFTHSGDSEEGVDWTPMMLRLRDVFYEVKRISEAYKAKRLKRLKDPDAKEDCVEFLYLNGPDKGWNWGSNGRTNAAFIQGEARKYFKQFF